MSVSMCYGWTDFDEEYIITVLKSRCIQLTKKLWWIFGANVSYFLESGFSFCWFYKLLINLLFYFILMFLH